MRRTNIGQPQVFDETEVCSFDDIEREGIITVHPMKPNMFKNESTTFSGFKGKLTSNQNHPDPEVREKKYWFGIQVGTNADGSRKFKKLTLLDGRVFYLKNPEDAKEWHIFKHHFFMENSPNVVGRPRWKVESHSQQAKDSLQKATTFVDVFNFINNMSENKLNDFSRLFNMDPSNNTIEITRGTLVDLAMENPKKFLPYMNDTEKTRIYEIFERALSNGDIQNTGNERGFVYMGISLGLSKELAVEYLKKNMDMLTTLDSISKAAKHTTTNTKKVEAVKNIPNFEEEEEEEEIVNEPSSNLDGF